MSLDLFLAALFDHGRVTVPAPGADEGPEELAAAGRLLDGFEADWRLEFPSTAPRWDAAAGLYAARLLYRGAQGAVFREIGAEALRAGFDLPEPEDAGSASTHYSVDVAFRFLPPLARMAAGASADDPLVTLLEDLGRRWPLSSVGMPGVAPASIEPVAGHPGLLRLYVDRILAAGDVDRLDDPRVADAVRLAIGHHHELSPTLSRALDRGAPR